MEIPTDFRFRNASRLFVSSSHNSWYAMKGVKKSTKQDVKKDNDNTEAKSSTKWTDADDAVLVTTLTKEKAKGKWGDNNPKKVAWAACELALQGSERQSGGAPKIGNSLRNRWNKVSTMYICAYMIAQLITNSSNRNTI